MLEIDHHLYVIEEQQDLETMVGCHNSYFFGHELLRVGQRSHQGQNETLLKKALISMFLKINKHK